MVHGEKSRRKVLGLIPARGGSKGIPGKNLVLLAGRPLVGWVCEQALRSRLIDEVILSSDSDEIIAVARSFGVVAPFKRPAELARDDCLVIDVILHAVKWLKENQGKVFDYVCLLQPTSPFGRATDYDRAISVALEKDADTVVSLYRCDQVHPEIMFILHEDSRAEWYTRDPGVDRMARRQDLPPVYVRSGIVYVFRTSLVVEKRTLYGEKLYAIEVPRERSIGIDSPHDLRVAQAVAQEYLWSKHSA